MTEVRTRIPLPRLGMPWVTFRQHRATLIGVAVLLGGLAVGMIVTGLQLHAAYRQLGLTGCTSFTTGRCGQLSQTFLSENDTYGSVAGYLPFLPGLIGVFAGAPLVAREFEAATFRFAWTQGAGRTRWVVVQLLLIAAVLAVMTLAFSALYSWWAAPIDRVNDLPFGKTVPFEFEGLSFTAFTLFTFALGAFVGAVTRRTVAAMAATFAAWFVLFLAVVQKIRAHYLPPLKTLLQPPPRAWLTSVQDYDPAGHPLSRGQDAALFTKATSHVPNANNGPKGRLQRTFSDWLYSHHYRIVTTYQPAGRFWTFQIIEASWLLSSAVLLGAGVVWWARHRAT